MTITTLWGQTIEINADFRTAKEIAKQISYYDAAAEFGFKFTPKTTDKIMEKLEAAVKADFGKDAYIDWVNNVVMVVAK